VTKALTGAKTDLAFEKKNAAPGGDRRGGLAGGVRFPFFFS
jgi:hypothetical protein